MAELWSNRLPYMYPRNQDQLSNEGVCVPNRVFRLPTDDNKAVLRTDGEERVVTRENERTFQAMGGYFLNSKAEWTLCEITQGRLFYIIKRGGRTF